MAELDLKGVQERYKELRKKGATKLEDSFYAKYGEHGYCEHNFFGETWVRETLNGKFKKRKG